MKIAYVSSADFPCPAPSNRIQAALWIASKIMESMTKRGHETLYIGVDGSTVNVAKKISMGQSFHDIYPYDEWKAYSELQRIETFSAFREKYLLFVLDVLRKEQVDIVHFNTSPPIAVLPYIHKIQSPKIVTFHDPLVSAYQHIFDYFSPYDDTYFVSISQAQRNQLPTLPYGATVYNGVEIADFSTNEAIIPDGVLFLGRIKQAKGILDAVVSAKQAQVKLLIAGRYGAGDAAFIEKNIIPEVDGTTISMIGVVDGKEKTKLYQSAKALLFPIQWEEPFGLVMIEAMACGTPVIAYNRGSVSEIVKDGITGFIIDPDDEERQGKGSWIIKKQGIDGIVEAIHRIGEIERTSCRKHIEDHFTTEHMNNGYENLYRQVLKNL